MGASLLVEALYALGIGLVVGLEREHHDISFGMSPREPPGHDKESRATALGARTFALLGLLGWLLGAAAERVVWVLPVGLLAVAALVIAQHRRELADPSGGIAADGDPAGHGTRKAATAAAGDPGLTTEVAALVVALLGSLVHHDAPLAVGLALVTTLLLAAKPWTRSLLMRLRRIEVTATIQLLILIAIVLPLLPEEPLDRWDALPPRKVGMFIALIAGVQYVGYVLTRVLGPERGIGLLGLVGGLTSSTAVTVSMARAARATPALTEPGRLAVYLANTVQPARVVVIASVVSPVLGARVAIALAGMTVVLLGAAFRQHRSIQRSERAAPGELALGNPLALWSALSWGLVLCAVLFVSRLATAQFGASGLLIAAALSGLADVDAVTLAAAEGHRSGVALTTATLAIAIAVASNAVVKAAVGRSAGGRDFGRPVGLVFAIAVAATAVTTAIALIV